MDTSVIAIAVIGSLLFFGVLVWKAVWFIRKVNETPEGEDADNRENDSRVDQP